MSGRVIVAYYKAPRRFEREKGFFKRGPLVRDKELEVAIRVAHGFDFCHIGFCKKIYDIFGLG
jgi:hypothetical protein